MRLLGHPEATSAAFRLEPTVTSTHDVDTVALAWATIALGPGLATFEVP
jgi:hypothetical protein